MVKILALDTETTGLDLYHGAAPFFVTTCDNDGRQRYWEWDVNPITRKIKVVGDDVLEIAELIRKADVLVLHNAKFDYTAMKNLDPRLVEHWDWKKVRDTLLASHLLESNKPHNLTDVTARYLGDIKVGRKRVSMEKLETTLRDCCVEARRVVKRNYPKWKVAQDGLSDMPSAKESKWKFDLWLPRMVAVYECKNGNEEEYPEEHDFWHALEEYANVDSAATVSVWPVMEREINRRGLMRIYKERLKVIPIAQGMEDRGLTYWLDKGEKLERMRIEEAANREATCVGIAKTYGCKLTLPKGGNNKSLVEFCFGNEHSNYLNLSAVKRSEKTGAPSLDKEVMGKYLSTLDKRSKQGAFIHSLAKKRKCDTDISYLNGYKRFAIPVKGEDGSSDYNWAVIHPNLNPTGTNTLRWSSNNPNEQNIKRGDEDNKFDSLRYPFGPAPGREWWSLDAKNLELRIPAYECGEEAFIDLFERPDAAPYFGSNHLLISHILHPEKFEECVNDKGEVDGRIFKKKYKNTLYSWVKNGNFAVQYGAIDKEDGTGTADKAYHMPGAQAKIKSRFKKQEELNQYWIRYANKHGYVETIPDRMIDPTRGYPLLCTRLENGKILPTVPLNYHIQGTACWWIMMAMIRVDEQLLEWRNMGFDGWLIMQVHDEIVLDFPRSNVHPKDDTGLFRRSNLWRIRKIQELMELGGKGIGVPTPTSCEYHVDNWAEGQSI